MLAIVSPRMVTSVRVPRTVSSHAVALSLVRSKASPHDSMSLAPIPLVQKPFASSQIAGSRRPPLVSTLAASPRRLSLLAISSTERLVLSMYSPATFAEARPTARPTPIAPIARPASLAARPSLPMLPVRVPMTLSEITPAELSALRASTVSTTLGASSMVVPTRVVAAAPKPTRLVVATLTGPGRSLYALSMSARPLTADTPRPPPSVLMNGLTSSALKSRQAADRLSTAPRKVFLMLSVAPSNLVDIPCARASSASSAPRVPAVTS